jgi:hypothetical protein
VNQTKECNNSEYSHLPIGFSIPDTDNTETRLRKDQYKSAAEELTQQKVTVISIMLLKKG